MHQDAFLTFSTQMYTNTSHKLSVQISPKDANIHVVTVYILNEVDYNIIVS